MGIHGFPLGNDLAWKVGFVPSLSASTSQRKHDPQPPITPHPMTRGALRNEPKLTIAQSLAISQRWCRWQPLSQRVHEGITGSVTRVESMIIPKQHSNVWFLSCLPQCFTVIRYMAMGKYSHLFGGWSSCVHAAKSK